MVRQGGKISGNKTVTTKELHPRAQEDIILYSVFALVTLTLILSILSLFI